MGSYNDNRFSATALPQDTIPEEYQELAEVFAANVAQAYADIAKRTAAPNEPADTLKIKVTGISKIDKPRVEGDVRIDFRIESGTLRNGQRLNRALCEAAYPEGAPRSVTSSGNDYFTHAKPKADLLS